MRSIAVLFSLVLIMWNTLPAAADDAETVDAVNKVATALTEAWATNDIEAIKAMSAPNHIAVTPWSGTTLSQGEEIKTVSGIDYEKTNVTEPEVTLLSPNVALRTMTAKLKGNYKGTPLPSLVFISEIYVKEDGKWVEALFQATELP